ncbi:MAG: histidine phosphatase family protein [Mariniblastus sp.]
MRHAKSSYANGSLTDFERPLNKRGLRVAPQMAEFIHLQGLTPDAIVSSAATRAVMTADLFVEYCEGIEKSQLSFSQVFYHAPASVYLKFLEKFTVDSVNTLMFVGHNPGLEELVEKIGGVWEVMPTAAVAHFRFEVDSWKDIKVPIQGELRNVWRPKEINID